MRIYFGRPATLGSIQDAIPLYPAKEFASATRSTIPLLTLLIHAPALFRKIVSEIHFPGEHDLALEYTVGPFGGRGTASHTDVMLMAGQDALAIEAKWTEPMYATVRDWPERGAERTPNQSAVLQGWLDCLKERLDRSFSADDFNDVVYQMLHRAASAAKTGERPRLAYFLFKPSPDPKAASSDAIFDRLTDLWNLLGKPATFPFYAVEISFKTLRAYEPLRDLVKGEEATAEAVSAALQDDEPLFHFDGYRIRQVGQEVGQWISVESTS